MCVDHNSYLHEGPTQKSHEGEPGLAHEGEPGLVARDHAHSLWLLRKDQGRELDQGFLATHEVVGGKKR